MRHRYRLLGLLFLLSIVTYIDRVCIAVAGKTMQDSFGMSPKQWGWVLGAFSLAYGLFEIPSGILADRLGPRRVLTRIVVWWSAFTALTGAAVSYWQLLATRFLFGAGEAGAYPAASASILRWFPQRERARAQGIMWTASRLGAGVSGVIVIPIMRAYGWRSAFFIIGAFGLVWSAVWYWWFRDTPAEKPGVSTVELAEIGQPADFRDRRGLLWLKVLRKPDLWLLMIMYHTYCWGSAFYMSWMFTFLENGRAYSKGELVKLSWIPYVCGAAANFAGGFVGDALVRRIGLKWGRRTVGIAGLGACALFVGATFFTRSKELTVVFLALGLAGSDFMLPSAWAVCLDIGRRHAGSVGGAMNSAGQMGSFLSNVVFGYLVIAFHTYNAPLILMAAMSTVSALVWFGIDPTKPLSTDDRAQPLPAEPSLAPA